MNKMLVVVFDNEKKAYEGLNALRELHSNGDITLYANAIVNKDVKGHLHIEQTADEGPIGTATGLITGSLIGLLGGPVGFAIGAGIGSLTGLAYDIDNDSINTAFAEEVAGTLSNEKAALLAEIEENWTVPLDSLMEKTGGIVFRRLRYEVEEDQLQRESDAMVAEFKELEEELKEAGEDGKAKINNAIANLKIKAEMIDEQIWKKLEAANDQLDAKINKTEEQMKSANEKRKAKLKENIIRIKKEYKLRTDKLKQASNLISEAFNLKETAAV